MSRGGLAQPEWSPCTSKSSGSQMNRNLLFTVGCCDQIRCGCGTRAWHLAIGAPDEGLPPLQQCLQGGPAFHDDARQELPIARGSSFHPIEAVLPQQASCLRRSGDVFIL